MRLASHKLPKQVNKHTQSAKHKKSAAAIAKKAAKAEKKAAMEVEGGEPKVVLTDEQKEAAKAARKKANAHKVHYKKQILNRTHSNGPRAINK
jgi:hypothetical protein